VVGQGRTGATSFRRERDLVGVADGLLEELRGDWPTRLFGGRWRTLPPGAGGGVRGSLVWGPFEIALVFAPAPAGPGRLRFDLVHGPFTTFRYEAGVAAARLVETVTLGAPRAYGGARGARWFARRLLPAFEEVAA